MVSWIAGEAMEIVIVKCWWAYQLQLCKYVVDQL